MAEDPWSVVLELEIVLCGWSELVAGTKRLLVDEAKDKSYRPPRLNKTELQQMLDEMRKS
jgi:hypothetical protein